MIDRPLKPGQAVEADNAGRLFSVVRNTDGNLEIEFYAFYGDIANQHSIERFAQLMLNVQAPQGG